MPSGFEIVCFLFVVLAIVTLVGHGIWVFLAFVFGSRRNKRKTRSCPFCGKNISARDDLCMWCMRDLNTLLAAEISDIDAMLRQLKRLQQQNILQDEVVDKLSQRLKSHKEQLLRPQPISTAAVAPQPAAAPLPPPPETPAHMEEPHVKAVSPILQAAIDSSRPREAIILPSQEPEAQKSAHPAAPPSPSVQPQPSMPPAAPRRSWAEILGGFLAERNIRWTELIGVLLGGLLMVGSSVALVIAFWNQLESIPALKFLIFVGYSSAVFAAGLFVYHRWKLESTGRGLMVIATLLVPLNFLAMASFYKAPWGLLTGIMEIVSLGIFAVLVALSARVLTPEGRFGMVLAVIGNSVVVLFAARPFFQHSSPQWLLGAGCLPPILLMAAVGSHLLFRRDQKDYDASTANSLFTLLGIAVFCSAVALGLLIAQGVKSTGLPIALHSLAMPFVLAALSVLIAGLQIARSMADGPESEAYRTAGTAVALLGVVLQIAAIILSWPQPLLIVAVGVIGAAGLALLALRYDFPAAHAGAMTSLALAYLAAFYVIFDPALRSLQSQALLIQSDDLSNVLLSLAISSQSGTALAGLFLVFAAISEWFVLRGKRRHGKMYVGGAALAAIVGLMLVTAHGFMGIHADAVRATVLYAIYGAVCVFLSIRWQQTLPSPIGRGTQRVPGGEGQNLPSPIGRGAGGEGVQTEERGRAFIFSVQALSYLGWNLLAVAPMWLIRSPTLEAWQSTLPMSVCLFWLGAVWIMLAWMHHKPAIFTAGQIVFTAAALLGSLSWLEWQQWMVVPVGVLFKPENHQVFGIGLALLSLAWMAVRIASRPRIGSEKNPKPQPGALQTFRDILAPNGNWNELLKTRPAIDKIATYFVAAAQLILVAAFLRLGCDQELQSGIGGIKSAQISVCGASAWLLLGVLSLVVLASLWHRWRSAELQISLILAVTVPVLVAERFVNQLAVASAARWTLALCFVLCSSAVWARTWLKKLVRKLHAQVALPHKAPAVARGMLGAFSGLPPLLLTFQAAVLQLGGNTLCGPTTGTLFDRIGTTWSYLVPLLLVMLGLVGHALRE